MRLKNKVAVVTGAQKGIGAAIAMGLAREGAAVVVNWLDDEVAANALVDAVHASGGNAVAVRGDVSRSADVDALFAAANSLGGVDLLVNNAGIFPRAGLLEMSEADWDLVHDVNLKGTWRCLQAAARSMIAAGRGGAIVNLSSVVARSGAGLGVHYVASKAGVIGLTRGAAEELAPHGIRVNAIAPGLVDTDQPRDGMSEEEIAAAGRALPLGRIARPEEIADAALFLCSDESRHMTGQTLHVNGGQLYV